MSHKLSVFSQFANELYPHETDYLLQKQKFTKPENIKILNLANYNSKNPLNRLPYDKTIDKRVYSYMKNWITETLTKADVDVFYQWLLKTEQMVMTDSITPEAENELIMQSEITTPSRYYFIRFYQVMQHYRDYLMVRNRIRYYQKVTEFLEKYHINYIRATKLNSEMNDAAERIVKQIDTVGDEFSKWEKLFSNIYYDTSLDGYSRYRAVVRLTILYYTNREFEKLRTIYNHLDVQFKSDVFYSKRILANYYHNRAMMHSKLNELDIAEKYGYLAIRRKNNDYLFYLVSLCGILLHNNKSNEALKLMALSMPELKNTTSFHSKIGFVSFYIKTLCACNQFDKAVNYGTTFFEAYKKEIFQYRWHLFFSAYILSLVLAEKYQKIISLSHRYKLVNKEKQYLGKAGYLPVIYWYTTLSEYMEGEINCDKFCEIILKSWQMISENQFKIQKMKELLHDMAKVIPAEIKQVAEKLNIQM